MDGALIAKHKKITPNTSVSTREPAPVAIPVIAIPFVEDCNPKIPKIIAKIERINVNPEKHTTIETMPNTMEVIAKLRLESYGLLRSIG